MSNGIPDLYNQAVEVVSEIALLVADAVIIYNMFGPPQWGIFQNGAPVMTPDSILAVEYRIDWKVADYPMEGGSFQSYDKVVIPDIVKVTMTAALANIMPLYAQLAKLAVVSPTGPPPAIVDIVTPKLTYSSFTINHVDTRRTSKNGVTLLTLDVWFIKVRTKVASTTTKSPSGKDPDQGGNTSPQVGTTPEAPAPTTTPPTTTIVNPNPPVPGG